VGGFAPQITFSGVPEELDDAATDTRFRSVLPKMDEDTREPVYAREPPPGIELPERASRVTAPTVVNVVASYTFGAYRVDVPVFRMLPPKLYFTWFPLTISAPVQAFVTFMEHSGKETGRVKSLRLAVGDVEDRVSEKKVLKQGRLEPKIALRFTAI